MTCQRFPMALKLIIFPFHTPQLMEEDQLRIMDVFHQNDKDGDNRVSKDELHDFMVAQGLTWKEGQLDRIFSSLDSDNNGYVDMQEFKNACRSYTRNVLRGKQRDRHTDASTKRRSMLKNMREKTFTSRASRQRTNGFFRRRSQKLQEGDADDLVGREASFLDFPKFIEEWSKMISQVCI